MTCKRTLLFFSLVFTSFFCAAQKGCIILYGPGAADDRVYITSYGRKWSSRYHWYGGDYKINDYVLLKKNHVWCPYPGTPEALDRCTIGPHSGLEANYTQVPIYPVPIDTNTFLLIPAVGIIGYFAIYRRHRFA